MPQISMGQWRKQLGDIVAFEQVPKRFGLTSMQALRAVKTGKVPLHTFRAADGRVFRMVKTRDIQAYQAQASAPAKKPEITMAGMKAALRQMTES